MNAYIEMDNSRKMFNFTIYLGSKITFKLVKMSIEEIIENMYEYVEQI